MNMDCQIKYGFGKKISQVQKVQKYQKKWMKLSKKNQILLSFTQKPVSNQQYQLTK